MIRYQSCMFDRRHIVHYNITVQSSVSCLSVRLDVFYHVKPLTQTYIYTSTRHQAGAEE